MKNLNFNYRILNFGAKLKKLYLGICFFSFIFCIYNLTSFAQEEGNVDKKAQIKLLSDIQGSNPEDILVGSKNVTLDFQEADIRNVLKIISLKSGSAITTII